MGTDTRRIDPAKEAETSKTATCFHCGLDCADRSYAIGEKVFCCGGCMAVYRLLHEHGLASFYADGAGQGVRPSGVDAISKYAFLDNSKVVEGIVKFSDANHYGLQFKLPQIHCSSCIWLLENLGKILPGVVSSRVDFLRREIDIVIRHKELSVRRLVEFIHSLGYEPDLSPEKASAEIERKERRRLYIQTGVAGFVFANTMLFALPGYLAGGSLEVPVLEKAFSWISAVLSLAVVFYAARPYFTSAWGALTNKFLNIDVPIALGVVVLFLRSWYEVITATGTGYFDSLSGLVFFLLVGRLFQRKTYDWLSFERDYRDYFPLAVTRKRGEMHVTIRLSDLEVGDTVIIRHQEIIPADAELLSEHAEIDYSFITGESETQQVEKGKRVYAGGRQMGGAIEVRVQKAVSESRLTSMWQQSSLKPADARSEASIADRVAHYFTPAVLGIAAATAIYWLRLDSDTAFNAFTAVLIVACPCALALASPFVLGTAQRMFGRAGFFLRAASVVEKLSRIRSIVLDKTGTLAISQSSDTVWEGEALSDEQKMLIASAAVHSTHPASKRIVEYLKLSASPIGRFEEIPGSGIVGSVDGHEVRIGSGNWITGEDADDVAHGAWVAIDGKVLGAFHHRDRIREGLDAEISRLKERYKLSVLTGDSDRESERLRGLFGEDAHLAFRQSPQDKLAVISAIHDAGDRVLMIGDGLNDSGALAGADVGIAVAENTSAFTPASDGILSADQLQRLSQFLSLARKSRFVLWLCYVLSFLYNIVGLAFAVTGQLSPVVAAILMPVSSITVVGVATGLTGLIARREGFR